MECSTDTDCVNDKTCINGHCIDGCSLPGACGVNAFCQTILHTPQCSCLPCHSGDPHLECLRLANCDRRVICSADKDCISSEACIEHECVNPCLVEVNACEPLKKCETRNHKPVCSCKYGHMLTENGELLCAPAKLECLIDEDCASNLTCSLGRCHNPCDVKIPLCEPNRTCAVVNHRPVCLCMDDCNPSLSMCLRDAGCSPDTVCRNYECINPCSNITCPNGSHCFVENHTPICKFCNEGWSFDQQAGCVRSKNICILG